MTLLAGLEQRDKQLRRALAQQNQSAAETARLGKELRALTSERQRLVDELSARDSAYRAELAEYWRLIAALADSPNPERRQALQRYADGDRVGAFAVLEELTRVEEAARDKANKLRSAAEYRQLAALAADMQDRGEKTTNDVLQLWRAAAQRDTDDFRTWVYIGRLTEQSGDTAQVLHTAGEARRVANDDRECSVAAVELGDLKQAAGDLAAARRSFDESLQIARRRLAAANPASAQAQRDVAVSLAASHDRWRGHLAAGRRRLACPAGAWRSVAGRSTARRRGAAARGQRAMSDCFVRYNREDWSCVEPLVTALRAAGVSVRWVIRTSVAASAGARRSPSSSTRRAASSAGRTRRPGRTGLTCARRRSAPRRAAFCRRCASMACS